MKYIILLSLVISFSNLKKPTVPKFNLKSLLEKRLKSFSSFEDDKEKCYEYENEDTCIAANSLNNKNFQCCYVAEERNYGTDTLCDIYPKQLENYLNLIKSKEFNAMAKEYIGVQVYGKAGDIYESEDTRLKKFQEKDEIICKDNEFTLSLGYDEYTDYEKETLNSYEACSYYYFDTFVNHNFGTPNCKAGKLLQSSKDAGLECGNMEVKVKINGKSRTIKSCVLYSYDFYKNFTNADFFKYLVEDILDEDTNDYEQYIWTFSDRNGMKKISIALVSSRFLIISRYLFILILLLS